MGNQLFHWKNGRLFWQDSVKPFPLSFCILLFAALLYNPTYYYAPASPWLFYFIPQEALPFLALTLILPSLAEKGLPFFEKKTLPLLFYGAMALYTCSSLFHIFSDFSRHGLWNLGLLLFPPVMLLFFLKQREEYSGRLFVLALLPFALVNGYLLTAVRITGNVFLKLSGITGNSNWTSAIFLVTSAAFLLILYDILKNKLSLPAKLCIFFPLLAAGLYVWKTFNSLGSFLALVVTLFLTGILFLPKGSFRKRFIIFSLFLGVLGVLALAKCKQDHIIERLATDERLTLWEGTLNMISDKPFTGAGGVCCFENDFVPYKPLEYFFKSHVAPRTSHPHNELLYFLASGGLIAGLPLIFLLLFPLFYLYKKYLREKPEPHELLLFAMYLYFILHGQTDCFFPQYPNQLFLWLFSAFAWSRVFQLEKKKLSETGNSHE